MYPNCYSHTCTFLFRLYISFQYGKCSGVNGWKTGDEVQAANRWTERMSGMPPPQHTEHRRRELSLPEKRVRENIVSSSIHQGLGRSPSRQLMFRNLQTILSILSHFCATFWLIF